MSNVKFSDRDTAEKYFAANGAGDVADPYIPIHKVQAATVVGEYNVTLTSVDTQYSQALPTNCKGIEFVSRNGTPVRYAFTTGKVATPTAPYFVLKAGCAYEKSDLDLSSKTIYFATDYAGDVVELITWS